MLKFTDWDCASVRKNPDQSDMNGDTGYLPPESTKTNEGQMTPERQETSDPHDVWSLGCVFVELLLWKYHGPVKRRSFITGLDNDNDRHPNGWFTASEHPRCLLHHVVDEMRNMKEGKNAGYASVVDLKLLVSIIETMLAIDPINRIIAERAWASLQVERNEIQRTKKRKM